MTTDTMLICLLTVPQAVLILLLLRIHVWEPIASMSAAKRDWLIAGTLGTLMGSLSTALFLL